VAIRYVRMAFGMLDRVWDGNIPGEKDFVWRE
jgi:hypothetical protein